MISSKTLWAAAVLWSAALVSCADAEEGLGSEAEPSDGVRKVFVPEPLKGPWVVALQPGHWKVDELPDELYRLRTSTGTAAGGVREATINLAVVDRLKPLLEAEGWTVLVVPATVPPGLRADAFVSVHADGANDGSRRGWKLAPPWRASNASQSLADALASSFSQQPWPHDAGGITVGMRGYFSFSPRRFEHTIRPYTPAVLVELGFVSNAQDRGLLVSDPGRFARVIRDGLRGYFGSKSRASDRAEDLVPKEFPRLAAGDTSVAVRVSPRRDAALVARLEPGTPVSPVGERGGWYEVFVRSSRTIGWVDGTALVPLDTAF